MSIDRDDVLLAFRALKRGHLSAGDVRKAFRKQDALAARLPLFEVLRSELRVSDEILGPIRGANLFPDPRADRPLLDELSALLAEEGLLTPPEFEKLAASLIPAASAPAYPALEVPQRLGEYEVRWEMGREAPSVLFRGYHPKHGDVALKVFRPGKAPEGFRARVSEPHPGLVRMVEVVEAGGFTFLAMELVEGQPLAKLLAARKISSRAAFDLLEKGAKTLAELHERGHSHGSLRSSDFLVEKNDVRIKDFGGVDGSAQDDLRAFAEVLYEAAAGVPPYAPGESRETPPLPPAAVNKALDADADRIVRAALDGGFPTMRSLAEDLGRYVRREKVTARAVRRRKGRGALVAGGVVAVLAVGAAAWGIWWKTRTAPVQEPPRREESKAPPPSDASPKEEPRMEPPVDRTRKDPERGPEGPMTPHEERDLEERCYQAAGRDLEDLGKAAGQAVRRGPKRAWSYYYYARYLYEKRRYSEAWVHIEEAVQLRPNSVEYLDLRLRSLLRQGHVAKSIQDLRDRFAKRYVEIHRQIRALSDRIAENDRDGALYLERGAYYSLKGDHVQAESDYGSAILRGVAPAHHFRAHARSELERFPEALADVERFLAECVNAGGREEAANLRGELAKRVHPR